MSKDINHQNTIESPEINPFIYGQLIFNRPFNERKNSPSVNGAEASDYAKEKKGRWIHTSHNTQKLGQNG